jgi:ElaB/YqjD/DUF883 family membrane-anchored ribosome-binding protein
MTNTECSKTLEEKAGEMGTRVAESLESAADSVRAVANDTTAKINDLANQTGKKLDSTACRVRTIANVKMLGGLRSKVNQNPLRSLMVATAIGVVAGFSWRAAR